MTTPTPKAYQELVAELRDCKKAFDAAADDNVRLTLSRRQLRAVMQYLRHDPDVISGGLTAPLAVLSTATHDLEQGANVALLEKRPPSQPGKPPTNLSREVVQGCLAFALELLKASKMSTQKAATWVASEARRLRVQTADGGPVTSRQIVMWRSGISRKKAPVVACEVFAKQRSFPFNAEVLKPPSSAAKRKRCLELASALITSIANVAPQSAPAETRRARA